MLPVLSPAAAAIALNPKVLDQCVAVKGAQ
jgi:hypothetical protein